MIGNRVFSSYEHELQSKQIPIRIIRRLHNKNDNLVMHSHEFVELVIAIKGEANHVINIPDDKVYNCNIKAGDVFLIDQGESHVYYFDNDNELEIVNIIFEPSIISEIAPLKGDSISPIEIIYNLSIVQIRKKLGWALMLSNNELAEVEDYIKHIEDELAHKSTGYRMRVIMLLTVILSLLSRKFDIAGGNEHKDEFSKPADITKVISYLERNYCDEIKEEFLAKLACCTVRHLTRKFKQTMGDSIINYIHKLRIARACFLLLNTDLKVIEIASKVGFNDISFFNKVFLRIILSSPIEYRRDNK